MHKLIKSSGQPCKVGVIITTSIFQMTKLGLGESEKWVPGLLLSAGAGFRPSTHCHHSPRSSPALYLAFPQVAQFCGVQSSRSVMAKDEAAVEGLGEGPALQRK